MAYNVKNVYQEVKQMRQLQLAKNRIKLAAKAAGSAKQSTKKEGSETTLNQATSGFLKQAWFNLIPSYGLTLGWINLHVFLNKVFGDKFFCKLGAEWIPRTKLNQLAGQQIKAVGKGIGLVEMAVLGILDLIALIIIISLIAIIYYIFRETFSGKVLNLFL